MTTEAIDQIIKSINELSPEEKKSLSVRVRTTPEGIKAYQAFLYGAAGNTDSHSSSTEPEEDKGHCKDDDRETPEVPTVPEDEVPPVDEVPDNDEVPPPEVPEPEVEEDPEPIV